MILHILAQAPLTETITRTGTAISGGVLFLLVLLGLLTPIILILHLLESKAQTKLLKQQNENLALLAYQLGKK